MAKSLRITGAILMLALCASCSDDDNPVSPHDLVGSGNLISETRTVVNFHSVDFRAVGEVQIIEGAAHSVKVTVDDNLMEYLETAVIDGRLVIAFDDSIDPDDFDLLVELTMTDLNAITLTGVGAVHAYGMTADDVMVTLTGVGDAYVSVTDHLTAVITGVGSVYYRGNPQTDITITGVGSVIDDN